MFTFDACVLHVLSIMRIFAHSFSIHVDQEVAKYSWRGVGGLGQSQKAQCSLEKGYKTRTLHATLRIYLPQLLPQNTVQQLTSTESQHPSQDDCKGYQQEQGTNYNQSNVPW